MIYKNRSRRDGALPGMQTCEQGVVGSEVQVDGEPWKQAACEVEVKYRDAALMLRHLSSAPLARMAAAVSEALDSCQVSVCALASLSVCCLIYHRIRAACSS